MNDLSAFRGRIFKYTLIVALLAELGSIPFLGLDAHYAYGLALGTCVAIMNFNILYFSSKKVLEAGNKGIAVVSYLARLCIYGFAFFMSMKVSLIAGLACIGGFVTLKLAIFYIYGIKMKVPKNVKTSPEAEKYYEALDRDREAHKGDRWIDKVKREINYQEDRDTDRAADETEGDGNEETKED